LLHPMCNFTMLLLATACATFLTLLHVSGVPADAALPAMCPATGAESMYFTSDVNWTCAATFSCLQTRSMPCPACCVTLAASLSSDCIPELREAYPSLLYSPNRALDNITTACVAWFCEELASHSIQFPSETLENDVCTFPNFSFPPPFNGGSGSQNGSHHGGSGSHGGNGDGECVNQGSNLFDDIPFSSCASVETCVRTMCSCVNGSYLGGGNCNFPSSPQPALAQRCLGTALSCVVNQALSLYVPQTDETNPTVDVCVRWSVPIARSYKEYYAANNMQATDLCTTCNHTACKTLGDPSLFAAVCAF
ncbi:membrane-associated protein, putative, partial [Bodo saltans]